MAINYDDTHCVNCDCGLNVDVGDPCACLDIDIKETIINLAGGVDKNYIHTQDEPSDLWIVEHGLNKFPSVSIVNADDIFCWGEVRYINNNTVELRFGSAFSGKAYFN